MKLIMNGDIDSAFKRLEEWYPQVLKDDVSVICFLLHSQRFIEYIRAEQLEGAVKYARANLANFLAHKAFEGLLKESVALLAYEKPSESCIGYLLESPQREFVADAVNAAILSTNPKMKDPESCLYSCLEKLLRQLTVCSSELRAFNSDQGDVFLLHKEIYERSRRP
ncbi:unnamed protein product [Triticum turgidum subsp. durum]|uniref:CTLH domain-containing protein n=1 Tax=Triticum turgidum subsp. durum TaxID=4567 RepID=A0A9R0YLS2_TRITD|nr:unnamed protein product [Triticum turgidum subsp. durum]